MPNLAWSDSTNILCVRPDNIGDVLMCTPAIRALKLQVPSRRITLLTSSSGAAIAKLIPEIDHVIRFDAPWVRHSAGQHQQDIKRLIRSLQSEHFDAAVLFTSYSQSPLPAAMVCYQAHIPRILGHCKENPYGLITDWIPDPEPLVYIRHEVDRQLELVAAEGVERPGDTRLSLHIPPGRVRSAKQKLAQLGLNLAHPWLVLHAGASDSRRRYHENAYATAAQRLIREGWQVVLSGSAAEQTYIGMLAKHIGIGTVNTSGKLSIGELCALLEITPIMVTNNTGPAHIAAAVQTPTVVLYAQTNPQHTPWQVASRVLYFAVEPTAKSKNRFLQTFPGTGLPLASPDAIVRAVQELSAERR